MRPSHRACGRVRAQEKVRDGRDREGFKRPSRRACGRVPAHKREMDEIC